MTSVEATKRFVETAQMTPFEARGQVFVIASAESLSAGAADALLKNLEEPHEGSPRHFLLLAPSQFDLSPTLRSRSLSIFLGASERLDEGPVAAIGLTCQRSTCLVWDRETGQALTPALSWQDTSQTVRAEALANPSFPRKGLSI